MSFRKLTISYENFHDEQEGLVPYLANAVMMLIRKNDMESLQDLMNNIATVVDQLLDLNDEIVAKKEDYDQLMNRMEALREDMAQKEAAQAALQEQMKELMGGSEEEEENDEELEDLVDESEDDEKSPEEEVEDVPTPFDPLSELDDAFGSISFGDDEEEKDDLDLSEITVENVMSDSNAAAEMFKASGVVFGEDINKLAEAEKEDLEEEDDIYDYFDLQIEDVDQGYQPLDKVLTEEEKDHVEEEQDAFDTFFGDDFSSSSSLSSDIDFDSGSGQDFDDDEEASEDFFDSDEDDYSDIFDEDDDVYGYDDGGSTSVDDFVESAAENKKEPPKKVELDVPTTGMVDMNEFL